MADTTPPLEESLLSAMRTTCYVCAEVKAGLNQRALAEVLRDSRTHGGTNGILDSELSTPQLCELCARTVCSYHRWICSTGWRVECCRRVECCLECRVLHYDFGGLKWVWRPKKDSFRRLWRLFRWRVTKRRLVDRLRIGSVVVRVLPNDLAQLVATYAVK